MSNPVKLPKFVMGMTSELHELGLRMIQESLESMDEMIQDSSYRIEKWVTESHMPFGSNMIYFL